jgi:putative Mg2+ transporter-C (MgtC) family protein
VRGLTPAAGLWSVAAVGLAIGGGMYMAGLFATLIIIVILAVIKPLEQRMFKNGNLKTILLTINIKQVSLAEIESIVKSKGLEIAGVVLHSMGDKDMYQMKLTFRNKSDKLSLIAIIELLNNKSGVSELNLRI